MCAISPSNYLFQIKLFEILFRFAYGPKMPTLKTVDCRKIINSLPDELILYIFKLLPLEDLLICENVCNRWQKLSQDPVLWRDILVIYSEKPGQTEISEKNLHTINTHLQCLSCVKLQYIYHYSSIMSLLRNCQNIISLELVMCRISNEFTEDIKMWPKLKKLNLKNSMLFQISEIVIDFVNLPALTYVALSDFGLSSHNYKGLLECKHLSHIFIEKIRSLSVDDIKHIILSKQRILKSFHIYGGEAVDDKCLHLMSQCYRLTDLAIVRCEKLTDEGLLLIGNLKQLRHLQIWNNLIFSELGILKTLGNSNLFALNSLSLSRIANISPVIVDVISEQYKQIKFLALYQCPRIINTDYEKQLKSKFRNIDVVLY